MKSIKILIFVLFNFCNYHTMCFYSSSSTKSIRYIRKLLRNHIKYYSSNVNDANLLQQSLVTSSNTPTIPALQPLLFSFGVIADIQYVDAPDAMNFQKTSIRRYRQSFEIFKKAILNWSSMSKPPACAIVLGKSIYSFSSDVNLLMCKCK